MRFRCRQVLPGVLAFLFASVVVADSFDSCLGFGSPDQAERTIRSDRAPTGLLAELIGICPPVPHVS